MVAFTVDIQRRISNKLLNDWANLIAYITWFISSSVMKRYVNQKQAFSHLLRHLAKGRHPRLHRICLRTIRELIMGCIPFLHTIYHYIFAVESTLLIMGFVADMWLWFIIRFQQMNFWKSAYDTIWWTSNMNQSHLSWIKIHFWC